MTTRVVPAPLEQPGIYYAMRPVTVKEPFNPSEGLTMMSRICLTLALFSLLWVPAQAVGQAGFGQYEENPFVFALDIPGPADSAGGLVAALCGCVRAEFGVGEDTSGSSGATTGSR